MQEQNLQILPRKVLHQRSHHPVSYTHLTGKTCDSDEANRVIAMIRGVVKEVAGAEAADAIRILYGGSVKPSTIAEQMSKSDIDGALVGGASLKADSFNEIIANTMKVACNA